MNKQVDFTGTVSEGTMRDIDMIPAFLRVLEKCEHPRYQDMLKEALALETTIDEYGFHYVDEESATYLLVEDIWDAMHEVAPEGFYFGAHPGDGSDYGFWSCELLD